ncbi:MAG: hypothetical protein LW630_05725 [Saprospiraceae bacterium]|nr:hypothetical protein [Saprospiraceae bacterium]
MLPINNKTTGELSDQYDNYFVPSGFTFSIWGLIYLLIITFSIFTVVQAFSNNPKTISLIHRLSGWFIVANLANGLWLVFWHYEWVVISLLVMLVILFNLLDMYYTLVQKKPNSLMVNLCLTLPVSIYLAWISVATIANVTASLVSVQWDGGFWQPSTWAIVMICIAVILGIFMVYIRQDQPFALVIAWALFGIFSKRLTAGDPPSLDVAKAAQYGFTLLLIYSILSLIGKKSYFFEKE